MEKQKINNQPKSSLSSIIFTGIFMICFCSILIYFLVFRMDDIRIFPHTNGIWKWALYICNLIISIAVLIVLVFAPISIIWATTKYYIKPYNLDAFENQRKQGRNMLIALICFLVVGFKILGYVFLGFLSALIPALIESPGNIFWLLLLLIMITIPVFLIWFFRKIILKFIQGNKKVSENNSLEKFCGFVIDKKQQDDGFVKRGTASYSYSLELDNGKKFYNIQKKYFDSVAIGQKVEIHILPDVEEILSFYVYK